MTLDMTQLADLPALQQLARALWHNGSIRGAALLVGAGFSKNAVFQAPDTKEPPDWGELLSELVKQLYPSDEFAKPQDALRIAEEYRSYFGQAALDGYIRTRFPDRSWLPGPLHTQVLKFPWSEVLTTNWDTLLERAAEDVTERFYEVVRTEIDIPQTRSPRIVKLHGTIGDKDPTIFAAEDYRAYPTRHATFVNLARQVFVENDLCLLGFSGNDPNFLDWAGWVRDHLGGNARRIYLAGYLNLSMSARKFLESQNIAPIDFAPLVKHLPRRERYRAATEKFLQFLAAEQPPAPHKWVRHDTNDYTLQLVPDLHAKVKDEAYGVDMLRQTARLLSEDRNAYPHWVVCPSRERHKFFLLHEWAILKPGVLARVPVAERAQILNELVWRCSTTFQQPSNLLRDALVTIMAEPASSIERSIRLRFAVALMRDARIERNEANFKKWQAVVETEAGADEEERREAQYQKCLWLRDGADLLALAKEIAPLSTAHPVWRLRQAGLYCEVGAYVKAIRSIQDTMVALEKTYRLDRKSIWIKSCLGWASWLSRIVHIGDFKRRGELPEARDFRDIFVEPGAEIEALESAANELIRKTYEEDAEIKPLFDPGTYRRGKNVAGAGPETEAVELLYELDQLMEAVGVPMRINNVNVAAQASVRVVRASYFRGIQWYVWLLRTLHSPFDTLYLKYFGRVAIAQLSEETASELRQALLAAIGFWKQLYMESVGEDHDPDRGIIIDRLRLSLAALSHLSVRMSETKAVEAFRLGASIAHDKQIRARWIFEAAGELTKYALEALPKAQQAMLILEVIEFPLAIERGGPSPLWPDLIPVVTNVTPARDPEELRWNQRIRGFLDIAAGDQEAARQEPVERLAYLATHGILTQAEQVRFGEILWSKLDGQDPPLPAGTRLLISMIAKLPAPAGIDPVERVTARILGPDLGPVMDGGGPINTKTLEEKQNHLISLYNMAPMELPIPPNRAVEFFDQAVGWSPASTDGRDPFGSGFTRNFNERASQQIGDTLTFAIVPAMPGEAKNLARLDALFQFMDRTSSWTALGALPAFVASVPEAEAQITDAIRRGLAGADHVTVSGAVKAVLRWSNLVKAGARNAVPEPLIEQLIAMLEVPQNDLGHILLAAAVALANDRMLSSQQKQRLLRLLADLKEEARYEGVNLDSKRAITISLIRKECVRLAQSLTAGGEQDPILRDWIEQARHDPLPEVRFAAAE